MAPVSAAFYTPPIVFNCFFYLFLSLSFSFPVFFSFSFLLLFFHFQLFCPFLTILFILALLLILMDLFLCFDIFKQFCYLAKCFVDTCKTFKYAKIKTPSLQNYILHIIELN